MTHIVISPIEIMLIEEILNNKVIEETRLNAGEVQREEIEELIKSLKD